jgi:ATP-binding cassette subfamily B protein
LIGTRAKKFFSYYRPYWRLAVADIACAALVSAITLALPLCARYITQFALDDTVSNAIDHVHLMGAVMIGLVALYAAANTFVDYQGHMMGARMERDMRAELFDHYQKLSFSFYDEQKTGQLMTRLTNDIFWLSELFHHGPEDLIIALLTFLGAFGILASINVELTLIVFAFLPVMAVYAFYFNKRMNIALRLSHDRVGDINAQVEDTLAGVRVVQSFGNEDIETRKFAEQNNRFLRSRGDGYWSEAYLYSGINAFTQLILIAVIVFGAVAISSASLDPADLVTYLLCVGILIEPVKRALNINRLYQEGITGFTRFIEMLEVQPQIVDAPDAVELPPVRGNLTFRNVSFKYQDGHAYVLKDISLDIRAGEYVALVGSSGVGKTTLCSLVPRFYDVTSGEILLDGVNIRDVTLRSLRRSIGVVQQDVYLFAGTVAGNIGYGRPGATREEIVEAAKRANAHAFIMALPDGYDTDIGQRGVKLSGGQKQRISIARVFLKDPPVLIFDEATSALDNESEKAVQESLEALAYNRTTLVIAHRLSTIQRAHRIVVLTDAGIEEQGTHEALLARGGAYARLYNVRSAVTL